MSQLVGVFVMICFMLSCPSAAAQVSIPDIQSSRQEAAKLLGAAYLQALILNTCKEMFPDAAQISAALEPLVIIVADANVTDDERRAIGSHINERWPRYELMLKTSQKYYWECTTAAQTVGMQIAAGIFNGLKKGHKP